jgi:hypothetical protein
MQTFGNLLFSIILSFAGFSSFFLNDSWPTITLEKQITTYKIPLIFDNSQQSHADKFLNLKKLLIKSYGINNTRAENFADWILLSTLSSDITPETMAALIMTESSFRYEIKSHAGAVGPAQVIPFFWNDSCHGDLENDPQMNIKCGVIVLEKYKKRCNGSLKCAFEMYNVGPTNFYKKKFDGAKKRYYSKIINNKNQMLAFKEN